MTSKFNPAILPALFYILLFSCGTARHAKKGAALLPGTWQSQPIVIDGDSKDWPSPYPNYDAKALVAYATSNDKQYLYITMETGDELTQMKILKQGLTVSIDTSGGKEPQSSINYPLQNDNDPMELAELRDALKKDNPTLHTGKKLDKKINKLAGEANQLSFDGFKGCAGGYMISQNTACGIKVKLRIDEYKELVWEAAIPFTAIYNKEQISAADAGKPISVCFAVKGFKYPESKTGGSGGNNNTGMNNNMSGTGMNSSMGGRGAGGRSGTRGGSSENPLQQIYESTKTWKHFGLAYQ